MAMGTLLWLNTKSSTSFSWMAASSAWSSRMLSGISLLSSACTASWNSSSALRIRCRVARLQNQPGSCWGRCVATSSS